MAEFLVRIREKQGHNDGLLGADEVVVVCEDGWPWSVLERTNPDWRILLVPGMALSVAEMFVAPEPVDETLYVKRRRAFTLDFSAFDADFKKWMKEDKRQTPTMKVDGAKLEASRKLRAPKLKDSVLSDSKILKK